MNRRAALFLVAALPFALAGCTQSASRDPESTPTPAPRLCTEILVAGLVVEVRDARTGLPAAYDASGTITDGAYKETLSVEGGMTTTPDKALLLVGAWERPGIYDVVVEKPGYRAWSMSQVAVITDECHVLTVHLQADLEPAP